MYTIILVDDEDIILRGLSKIIPWEKLGYKVIGYYNNGKQALSAFETHKCDVILTDIKMPVMDGIQMVQELRHRGHETQIIFMSGYDDFKYAQSATKLGAADYVLKPTTPAKIENALRTVRRRLDSVYKISNEMDQLNSLAEKSIQSMIFYIFNVLKGAQVPVGEIVQQMHHVSPQKLVGKVLLVATYHFCHKSAGESHKNKFIEHLSNYFENKNSFIILDDFEEMLSVCYINDCKASPKEKIQSVSSEINKFLGNSVIYGLGDSYDTVYDVMKSYCQSIEAVYFKMDQLNNPATYKNIYEEKINIFIDDAVNSDKINGRILDNFINELWEKDYNTRVEILQKLFEQISSRYSLTNIPAHLSIQLLVRSDNIDIIKSTLQEELEKISRNKQQNLCLKIRNYLKENFNKQITIKELSEQFYFTPNYLGKLFQKTTGQSVKQYLTDIRMEEAERLINTNKYKLYQICEMVGYKDYDYFRKQYKIYSKTISDHTRED